MLTPMEIGDLLDFEKEATYPCSDGSTISCISVDALADAAYKKALKEVGDEMMKMSTLQEFHALRVRLIQGKLAV